MSALDEHCNGTLEKDKLQSAIFDRYTKLYNSFVAENINGSMELFSIKLQKSKSNKKECKRFRNFMNSPLVNKKHKSKEKANDESI